MKKNNLKRLLDFIETELISFIGVGLVFLVLGSLTFAGLKIQQVPETEAPQATGQVTPAATSQASSQVFTIGGVQTSTLSFGSALSASALKIDSSNAAFEGNFIRTKDDLRTLGSTATIAISLDEKVSAKAYAAVYALETNRSGNLTINGQNFRINSLQPMQAEFTLSGDSLEITLQGTLALSTIKLESSALPSLSPAPVIVELTVIPKTLSLEAAQSISLKLIAKNSKGGVTELTPGEVRWVSSDSQVARIQNGSVTANAVGAAQITAYLLSNQAVRASASITVTPKPVLELLPSQKTVVLNEKPVSLTIRTKASGFDLNELFDLSVASPVGVRVSASPATIAPGQSIKLTFEKLDYARSGSYIVTVTATNGIKNFTQNISLTVPEAAAEQEAGSAKQEETTEPSVRHLERSEGSSEAQTKLPATITATVQKATEVLNQKSDLFVENVKESFTSFTTAVASAVQKLTTGAAALTRPTPPPAAPSITPPAAGQQPPTAIGQKVSNFAQTIGNFFRNLITGGTAVTPGPGAGATGELMRATERSGETE